MTDRTGLQARRSADELLADPTTVPVRTCVGCRRRDSWSALLRVVAVRDEPGQRARLVPDPRRRLPGRGAWLHPDPTCWEQAVRRKAFGRALRLQGVSSDGSAVEDHLRAVAEQHNQHEQQTRQTPNRSETRRVKR